MIAYYIKLAWRSMKKQRLFAAINIFGLALGVAACLLILQYVFFELSFEEHQQKADNVYRVIQHRYDAGKLSTAWAGGAYAPGNNFKNEIAEVKDYVKLVPRTRVVTRVNEEPVRIENAYYASESFFKIFSAPLLYGNAETALKDAYTVALSEKTAKALFGTTNVLGKTIEVNNGQRYTIQGVYENMPANTHLRPEMLFSYNTFIQLVGPDNNPETAWNWDGCLTYVELIPGADTVKVHKRMAAVADKYTGEEHRRQNHLVSYQLQPLRSIHLSENLIGEPSPNTDAKTVYLLMGVAIFIIVIAWINYVNLATARSMDRAREVGILKAIGSKKTQLIVQFITESAVLNLLAIALSIGLVAIAIPFFNRLSGQSLSFTLLSKQQFWYSLAGLYLIGVLFSGLYPAFVMSSFKPVQVLKGRLNAISQGGLLRRALVVLQFTASLFLLIATITVYKQLQFMRKQSLGINIDRTVVLRPPIVVNDSTFEEQTEALKQDILQVNGVKEVAFSTVIPGEPVDWNAGGIKLTTEPESAIKQYRIIGVDYDYIKMIGLPLVAGRYFDRSFGTDDSAVLFNRKGIEYLGFAKAEDAIGKKIDFWDGQYTIVGITENYHHQGLQFSYEPLIYRLFPSLRGYVSVKVDGSNINAQLEGLRKAWKTHYSGNTFEYFFLDDHFQKQYVADQQFGQVFTVFTVLAIIIACLGLFGLASFSTSRRTKEIGVRKVLGASVVRIITLLYKEFALVLVIASLIAIPLAYISGRQWLNTYPFRVSITPYFFLLPLALIVLIAFASVGFQCIKAAVANPVKSLRTE